MQLVLYGFLGAAGSIDVATCMSLLLPTGSPTIAVRMFIDYLSYNKLNKRIAFWWTDSTYRQSSEYFNRITHACELQTFAMLDLLRLDKKALPLMQTYDFDIIEDKDETRDVVPSIRKVKGKAVNDTPASPTRKLEKRYFFIINIRAF